MRESPTCKRRLNCNFNRPPILRSVSETRSLSSQLSAPEDHGKCQSWVKRARRFFVFFRWLHRISRILAVLDYEGVKQATPEVLRPKRKSSAHFTMTWVFITYVWRRIWCTSENQRHNNSKQTAKPTKHKPNTKPTPTTNKPSPAPRWNMNSETVLTLSTSSPPQSPKLANKAI